MSASFDAVLLELFHAELETHSRVLEEGLVRAEGERAVEKLEPLMRAAHSLKGAARMLGLDGAVRLAHAMEDVLVAAQRGGERLSASQVDLLLRGNDVFRRAAAAPPAGVPSHFESQARAIDELVAALAAPAQAPPPPPAAAPAIADAVLLELFRGELETHTRVLEQGLIRAEAGQSPETLEPLMRAAHSLKGAARMLGLDGAVRLAHAMEEMLVAGQRGTRRLAAADVDLLLKANDVFRRAGAAPAGDIPAALEAQGEAIGRLAGALAAPAGADAAVLESFQAEQEHCGRAIESGEREPLAPSAQSLEDSAGGLGLDGEARMAHAVAEAPAAAVAPPALSAEMAREAAVPDDIAAAARPAKPAAREPAPAAEDQSVRVTAQSLNRLVGLAGECLVETRLTRPLIAGLERIKQRQSAAAAGLERTLDLLREGDTAAAQSELQHSLEVFRQARDLVPKYLLDFGDWTRRLEILVNPLYAEAVATRMRPFSDGTHGYARMVRDLARELGKNVHFEIEGAATPVDRDILERLESPLTHLLRNALDHGIEPPAGRAAAGKPEQARLALSAHQVSGMLRIAVADDGAGINLAALRQKVVSAGYVAEAIARDLGEAELLEFLFLPGFSTARTVTEVSGRGVGLDVVHSAVRGVGGAVRIETRAGAGTTIELQLPLTLSIVRALVAEIAGELYALPLTRIDRLLRTAPESLEALEDRQFCTVDGQHVGVLDARQVLNIRAGGHAGAVCIVVMSDRLSRYGLVVDRLVGERDLVVKPLPACLGRIANVSAGAILDDGTPLLILDADDVVRSMDNLLNAGALQKVAAPAETARPRARRRVLVVDDSLTVREVERRLLENHGYEVAVAVDGMDGWNALQRGAFDLLVTDIDMPRMDGLELVRRVRAAPRMAALPVVIVSYKEQAEYRIKGMEAGANYYLTKSSFHDESLVGAVRDLVGEA